MPRPDNSPQRRQEFIPILAGAFADLGYRRATTAELARSCEVQETILYRLWPDKRAMFIAALEYVYQFSEKTWAELIESATSDASPGELILGYEASHHGEFGLYRIIFAGLSETDDPEISAALQRLYGRFQNFVQELVHGHRTDRGLSSKTDANLSAWGILGLGTVANIGRELNLITDETRQRLFQEIGRGLLDG